MTNGNASGGGATIEAVEAAARVAMRELTVARETVNAHLKEWQNDSLRMKALLQQLELTSRNITTDCGSTVAHTGTAAVGGSGSLSGHSAPTRPQSDKAEQVEPGEAASMERQTPRDYASITGVSSSWSNPVMVMEGGGADPPVLRAVQAQLRTERELRQRYEEEREKMKGLLRAKEVEVEKLKKASTRNSTKDTT
ncbi:hypothetical protein ABB37_02130 [Leptomonas pyrrhocoris]|uniref:Uncharacterized protein n=1 Tax=Leptomonas pyrrhocoris TaxID=157538 RepID=A0A0M9G7J5_LEPPY|nr:hypothetical protein ABB37_02130 [Leptomonas pyrrhocoris]KPA83986.1 hypothetical protein ABB37_02130 [Leptomonas pyrrhocoris]|eukprot:XP_015662425.1 hypothetical protein ABB37_02130 [Leptomonas pyrrhocoris]